EFHPLHSRCATIDEPDYVFFDLDPFEPAAYEEVLAVARLVKVSCERLGLTAYPKTSGATGMQIYVPIQPGFSYEETRALVGGPGWRKGVHDPNDLGSHPDRWRPLPAGRGWAAPGSGAGAGGARHRAPPARGISLVGRLLGQGLEGRRDDRAVEGSEPADVLAQADVRRFRHPRAGGRHAVDWWQLVRHPV